MHAFVPGDQCPDCNEKLCVDCDLHEAWSEHEEKCFTIPHTRLPADAGSYQK
jgi:hypothetical protein